MFAELFCVDYQQFVNGSMTVSFARTEYRVRKIFLERKDIHLKALYTLPLVFQLVSQFCCGTSSKWKYKVWHTFQSSGLATFLLQRALHEVESGSIFRNDCNIPMQLATQCQFSSSQLNHGSKHVSFTAHYEARPLAINTAQCNIPAYTTATLQIWLLRNHCDATCKSSCMV